MDSYIAFLRGINVSGKKKVPMTELRTLLTKNGLKEVKTYIQSGNIVFHGGDASVIELKHSLENIIKAHFGFEVPVLIKSASELLKIIRNNPFSNKEDLKSNKVYFVMLFDYPAKEQVDLLKLKEYPNESWKLVKDCLYLRCKNGYGKAKLNNNLVERKLKVAATTRNYRTMKKLLEMGAAN